jgi:hypothetical protein
MGSPGDLLDELARAYARAAVDEFLKRGADTVADELGDSRVDQLHDGAQQGPSSSGTERNSR